MVRKISKFWDPNFRYDDALAKQRQFGTHANPHCMKKTRMAPNINLLEGRGGERGTRGSRKGEKNGRKPSALVCEAGG